MLEVCIEGSLSAGAMLLEEFFRGRKLRRTFVWEAWLSLCS